MVLGNNVEVVSQRPISDEARKEVHTNHMSRAVEVTSQRAMFRDPSGCQDSRKKAATYPLVAGSSDQGEPKVLKNVVATVASGLVTVPFQGVQVRHKRVMPSRWRRKLAAPSIEPVTVILPKGSEGVVNAEPHSASDAGGD